MKYAYIDNFNFTVIFVSKSFNILIFNALFSAKILKKNLDNEIW